MGDRTGRRLRVHWAAIGAAVAVSLGAGGLGITGATGGGNPSAPGAFVAITPCRLVDTRPAPDTVGGRGAPLGAGEKIDLAIRGLNGYCDIPKSAIAVSANIVSVDPTAAGYFTMWPAGEPRPTTANLNWVAGDSPSPNKVDVKLGVDGKISVFNSGGTTHLILDVFGYYTEQNYDDRYLKKAEFVVEHAPAEWLPVTGDPEIAAADFDRYPNGTTIANADNTSVMLPLTGPASLGGRTYKLKQVEYCIGALNGASVVKSMLVASLPSDGSTTDYLLRSTMGCYKVVADEDTRAADGLTLVLEIDGTGSLRLEKVIATWQPV